MQYPVAKPSDWRSLERLSLRERIGTEWRDWRYRRRVRQLARDAALIPSNAKGVRPLTPADTPLIVCVKNGGFYIRPFLEHYRKIGVTRFIVLDDRSDDGTREQLRQETDVDLFGSRLDYTAAHRSLLWRDGLIDLYGRDRWYLNVDIDEFLIFPGCETRSVRDFIADLERTGRRRALAPMLDLYPDGPLSTAAIGEGLSPTDISPLIDGDGYRVFNRKFCTSIVGGPRYRLFGTEMRLTKFPVLYADSATKHLGASIHGPFPFRRNFTSPTAALLHFKFSDHSMEEFARIVERGTHFDGSRYYRAMIEDERFSSDADLRYDKSIRADDTNRLIEAGFLKDLRE
ncbi:glycosyltransferase family 2 protein [Fulvimarina sp. MAC3]|uniref:glycosyltransferase family 2 protein n=1 Tax=Fulvimarina sp. MAC3 TaxID=3148887 RepID=UPI0031FE3E55